MPDETIARLIGLDKQAFLKTVTALLDMGVASRDDSGALVSRRMIRDEELRQIRAEAGKKGGNPNLVKQNPTTLVNQNPTPSSSSSFTSSSSEVKTEETPQAAKPKRGSRIPDQFFLTSEMRDYGRQKRPDIDLDLETERFVNYWRAAAGRTATKLDWIAAWRTWILGANQHGKNFGAALAKRNDQDVIRESQDFYNNFS